MSRLMIDFPEVFKRLPALWCVGVGVILLAVLVIFLIYGLFN